MFSCLRVGPVGSPPRRSLIIDQGSKEKGMKGQMTGRWKTWRDKSEPMKKFA